MKNIPPPKQRKDIYSIVNDRIIEHLEKGVIPWRQPWSEGGVPQNLITGKHYRGINIMLLASLRYAQNSFLTFRQVQELGGTVKKGEKSCPVIYWNWVEKKNEKTQEIEKLPYLKSYNVFNIDQCEDIPKDKLPPPIIGNKNDPIKSCEDIINKMPNCPEIRHKENRAYYNRKHDYVNMPEPKMFIDSESYYGVLFHELAHSTGNLNRVGRKELTDSKKFGSKLYSIEELTAEMTACYLKSHAGIPIESLENNAAYIQHWLKVLRDDKKFIVHASAQAQKATDYILNVRNAEKEIVSPEKQENEFSISDKRQEELKKLREPKIEEHGISKEQRVER